MVGFYCISFQRKKEIIFQKKNGKKEKILKLRISFFFHFFLVGFYRISFLRKREIIFQKKKWKERKDFEFKEFVYEKYEQFCSQFEWNQRNQNEGTENVEIVPLLHGTDELIAEKICETGFAALSSLDDGYFGKGIYFTSKALYTIPYIISRRYPSILLSWVIPGNVYPVTEDHRSPTNSLLGSALVSGNNSHFVLTDRLGNCIKNKDQTDLYNEFVISQESQIIPAFIFSIDSDNVCSLSQFWNRPLPEMNISKKSVSPNPNSVLNQSDISLEEPDRDF